MYTTKQYMDMAEQAKKEGAHVAVVTYYRNAAETTEEPKDVEGIIAATVEYAGILKKPTDRKAVYEWAKVVAADRDLETLTPRIKKALLERQRRDDENATTSWIYNTAACATN